MADLNEICLICLKKEEDVYNEKDNCFNFEELETYLVDNKRIIKIKQGDKFSIDFKRVNNGDLPFATIYKNLADFNFQGYCGYQTIFDSINLKIEHELIPFNEFEDMLKEVENNISQLITSFDTPTGHFFDVDELDEVALYQTFMILNNVIKKDLQAAFEAIFRDPHNKLERTIVTKNIWEVRDISGVTVNSIISNPQNFFNLKENHPAAKTQLAQRIGEEYGKKMLPEVAEELVVKRTFDTFENRFVKHFLQQCRDILDKILEKIEEKNKKEKIKNTKLKPDCLEITEMVEEYLSEPIFDEVGELYYNSHYSVVLEKKEGYKDVLYFHSLLNQGTIPLFDEEDFEKIFDNKTTWKIYELWCFFKLKEIVDGLLEEKGKFKETYSNNKEKLKFNPKIGPVEYKNNGVEVKLFYQKTYGSNESNYHDSIYKPQPDISLEIGGEIEKNVYLFDAKLRSTKKNDKNESGSNKGKQDPKSDMLKDMHAYMDTIKGAKKVFALYWPSDENADENAETERYNRKEENDKEIGLIPLKLNYESKVENELRCVLGRPEVKKLLQNKD